MTVKVKPLVWVAAIGGDKLCHDHWYAAALGGAYHMAPDEDSAGGSWLLQWTIRSSDFCMSYGGTISNHPSPEAARAAAQADYEARILAALATPAPDAVQEAAIDIAAIENGGKRWHGEDHRVVAVRWEPYKPDGQRQMKAKGRWQEQVGSGDYWRWNNCDRPSALRAIAGDRT